MYVSTFAAYLIALQTASPRSQPRQRSVKTPARAQGKVSLALIRGHGAGRSQVQYRVRRDRSGMLLGDPKAPGRPGLPPGPPGLVATTPKQAADVHRSAITSCRRTCGLGGKGGGTGRHTAWAIIVARCAAVGSQYSFCSSAWSGLVWHACGGWLSEARGPAGRVMLRQSDGLGGRRRPKGDQARASMSRYEREKQKCTMRQRRGRLHPGEKRERCSREKRMCKRCEGGSKVNHLRGLDVVKRLVANFCLVQRCY